MAVGLAVAATLANYGVFLLGTFIRALGGGLLWVFSTQLLLHLVPNEVRGRVFSTEFAFMTLAMAMSTASGGWILDQTEIGIAGLLRTLTGIALIPGLLWSVWLVFGSHSEPPAR